MMVRRTKKVVLATNKSDAKRTTKSVDPGTKTESYRHPEAALIARPEAGQQARFKKRKPKATYRYDSSLAPEMNWPEMNWDGQKSGPRTRRMADRSYRGSGQTQGHRFALHLLAHSHERPSLQCCPRRVSIGRRCESNVE